MSPRISRIQLIGYWYKGETDLSGAPVVLWFDDGTVTHYDCGGDGEALAIKHEPWIDPFAGDLDEANRRWVADYGKHVAIDVSATPPYDRLIGHAVDREEDIRSKRGKVIGRRLWVGSSLVTLETGLDDLQVEIT